MSYTSRNASPGNETPDSLPARLNLRLMAKVMVGKAQRDRLYADEFTAYANALASLSRNEAPEGGEFFPKENWRGAGGWRRTFSH